MMKVFARLFQKAVRSRAHSPCRRPQAAKSPYGAFFLPSFFFAPASSKKKRVKVLCTLTVVVPFVNNKPPQLSQRLMALAALRGSSHARKQQMRRPAYIFPPMAVAATFFRTPPTVSSVLPARFIMRFARIGFELYAAIPIPITAPIITVPAAIPAAVFICLSVIFIIPTFQ